MAATHGSPPGSNNTSPGRESSEDSDDSLPLAQLALKRSAEANQQTVPPVSVVTGASAAKKAKTTSKKKKKKDPNEPQKPVSAYALFFRDTQAAIKGQNPNASFGEVSKIVASMWDSLDEEQKNVYKKKTEVAKKEYLKQLAAYRASLVSKGAAEAAEQAASQPKQIMPSPMGAGPAHPMQPLQEGMPPYMSPHHMGSMEMMGAHQMPPPNAPNPAEQHHHQMPNSPPQAMPMSPQMMQMNEQHMQVMSPDGSMSSPGPPMCVRPGCQNAPIEHPSWDQEFCSSGCVVDHCRDVFTAWVASRQNSYASVK